MPLLKWLTNRRNTKNITKEVDELELLQYICNRYYFMLTARIVSLPKDYSTYNGWVYQAKITINKGTPTIIIDVLDNISSLTNKTEIKEECVVCDNLVNENIKCCGQRVCSECLVKIKETSKSNELEFKCPMCRKNLGNYCTTHTLSKEYIDKHMITIKI